MKEKEKESNSSRT